MLKKINQSAPGKKCRVLMLLENNPYPGDLRVRREADSLVAAGAQVTVICPGKRSLPRYEKINGVHVYRFLATNGADGFIGYLLEYGWAMLASFCLTWWVFARRGFDVIHAHNPPDLFVLIAILFRPFGTRFVFDHHDLSPDMYLARFPNGGNRVVYNVLCFFEKLSCRMAHQVIATNDSYKKIEIERTGIRPDKITVVRNGPDQEIMKPDQPDAELRQKASTILGYVGMVERQDGVDYLIRALDYLVKELGRTDVYCVIIGRGSAVPDLKKLISKLGLDQYVGFTGYIRHELLSSYLSAADICVDPDPWNSFNDHSTMVKMMDYMAVGKPIVAFDLTEHRVSAGQAALYARRNEIEDFARKIAFLMDKPGLRDEMSAVGRKRIQDSLSWQCQEKRLYDVYRKLGFQIQPADTFADEQPANSALTLESR